VALDDQKSFINWNLRGPATVEGFILLVITTYMHRMKKGPVTKFWQQVTDRQRIAKGMMTGVSHK
jgi:hypothetical protein